MRIRLYQVAAELGLGWRVLRAYCREVGISVADSALTEIQPEERERLIEHIRQHPNAPLPRLEEAQQFVKRQPQTDECHRWHAQVIAGKCPYCGLTVLKRITNCDGPARAD